jgi:hypothetical protein
VVRIRIGRLEDTRIELGRWRQLDESECEALGQNPPQRKIPDDVSRATTNRVTRKSTRKVASKSARKTARKQTKRTATKTAGYKSSRPPFKRAAKKVSRRRKK